VSAILNRGAADAGRIGAAGSRAPQRDRTVKTRRKQPDGSAFARCVFESVFVVGFHDANCEVETEVLPRGIAAWPPERYCCTEQIVI